MRRFSVPCSFSFGSCMHRSWLITASLSRCATSHPTACYSRGLRDQVARSSGSFGRAIQYSFQVLLGEVDANEVALWTGLFASIAGIVLSIVAIVFTVWVSNKATKISDETIRSL